MNRSSTLLSLLALLAVGCPKDAPVEPAPAAAEESIGGLVGAATPGQPIPAIVPAPVVEAAGPIGELAPEQLELVERVEREGTVLKLLDPGAEPRRLLSISAGKGHRELARMTMTMTMTMDMGPMGSHTAAMPPVVTDMAMEVLDVLPDDRLVMLSEIAHAGVAEGAEQLDPAMVFQLEQSLGSMEGLRLEGTMDRQGRSVELDVQLPDDLDPKMREQFESMSNTFSQLTAPLPAEPVGLGARWDTSMVLDNNGLRVLQTAHYELESIEGDTITLLTHFEQALVGEGNMDGLPPGAEVEFLRFASSGQGRTVQDLSLLTPHDVAASVELDMAMRITAMGQAQEMGMRMAMEMGLEHLELE
jgi:muconolactone delta-isomerase